MSSPYKKLMASFPSDATLIPLFTGIACLLVLAIVYHVRPLLPADEVRYVGVAWNMWRQHQWIAPFINGHFYTQKPPLLFWLLNLGWALWGVGDLWPRLLPTLFGFGNLILVWQLAKSLWPQERHTQQLAPLLLLGMAYWTANMPILRFDIMLGFFALLAMFACVKIQTQGQNRWWVVYALALACGLLTKGPVILIFTLSPWLLIPIFFTQTTTFTRTRWYGFGTLALVFAAAVALLWVFLAVQHSSGDTVYQLLWRQTAGRMTQSFAHAHPVWWYIPALGLLFFPWVMWPPLWRRLKPCWAKDSEPQIRFCFYTLLLIFAIMSLISGKRLFYLFPLLPLYALLAARLLTPAEHRSVDHWPLTIFYCLAGFTFCLTQIKFIAFTRILATHSNAHLYLGVGLIAIGLSIWISTKRLASQTLLRMLVILSVATVLLFHGFATPSLVAHKYPQAKQTAALLARLQKQHRPFAVVGSYSDNYDFLGRLKKSPTVIQPSQQGSWLKQHPDGLLFTLLHYHFLKLPRVQKR